MPQENAGEYQIVMGGGSGQSTQDPNTLYADMLKEDKVMNIIAQINPENLVTEIEYRIKGYKKNEFTKEWEKINKNSPEISDLLVSNFVSFLSSALTQHTSLSNFSAQEINNLMEMVIDYIRDDFSSNDEIYGLQGKYQEMTRIGNMICFSIFSVLKRAQNGMEARRIFSSLRVEEKLTQAPQKGGWKEMLPWK